MAATFKKPDWWSEPDGFDPKTLYQMVPRDRRRAMSVVTDNEPWLLTVNFRASLKLLDIIPSTKLISIADGKDIYLLPKNSTTQFSIEGVLPGKSSLVLQKASGSMEGSSMLKVNVKELVHPNYKSFILADILGRKLNHPSSLFDSAIKDANKRLFDEANMQPILVGENLQPLNIPRDYKDGVHIDTQSDAEWAFWQKMIDFSYADYFIIFCGNLTHSSAMRDIAGLSWGKLVFIEPAIAWSWSQVVLHEIGHRFGLGHSEMGESIMQPMVSSPTMLFIEKEIDTLNPT